MSSLDATVEMMQGFKMSEKLPPPPVPDDLKAALDKARQAFQRAKDALAKLLEEQETLPLLISKSADSGNTVTVRKLKTRQDEIVFDIMQAEVDALAAELAAEQAKTEIASAQARIARQRFDEAVAAQEAAEKAVRIARAAYTPYLAKSLGAKGAELERRLEATKKRNARILNGNTKPDSDEIFSWMRESGWMRDHLNARRKIEASANG